MSLQFEDLFDWEKENDVHYYSLLNHIQEEEWEYMEWCANQEKEPAEIKVINEKSEKNGKNKNSSLPRIDEKRVQS